MSASYSAMHIVLNYLILFILSRLIPLFSWYQSDCHDHICRESQGIPKCAMTLRTTLVLGKSRTESWVLIAKAIIPTGKWPRCNLYEIETTWNPAEGLRGTRILRNVLASPTTTSQPFLFQGKHCIRKIYNRSKNV